MIQWYNDIVVGYKLPVSWPFPWSLQVVSESLSLTGYDQASLMLSQRGTLLYGITAQYAQNIFDETNEVLLFVVLQQALQNSM